MHSRPTDLTARSTVSAHVACRTKGAALVVIELDHRQTAFALDLPVINGQLRHIADAAASMVGATADQVLAALVAIEGAA